MTSLSRVTGLSLATLLAMSVLAGCSDDDKDETNAKDAAAGVQACRVFQLGGGADGDGLVQDLQAILVEGSYEPEPLAAEIRAVRAAAEEAGRTVDLPDADFKLFRAVVEAAATAQGAVVVGVGRSLEKEGADALRGSLDAVDERCAAE